MARVSLDELFFDFFDAVKPHVPESDHFSMCLDILRTLEDGGYDLHVLHGHDDAVDEALEEIFPDLSDLYDDGEYDE